MEDDQVIIWAIGIIAQMCFASRQIFQWWASEKHKSIQSPTSFWVLSMAGNFFFLIYGILRQDVVILLGNFINFYIAYRNLELKLFWQLVGAFTKYLILLSPILICIWFAFYDMDMIRSAFSNPAIGNGFLAIGTIGYLLFTLRFLYQWYHSEKAKTSYLPVGFFVASIVGSILIMSYGWYRQDWILIISYAGGLVVYFRNLYINYFLQTT